MLHTKHSHYRNCTTYTHLLLPLPTYASSVCACVYLNYASVDFFLSHICSSRRRQSVRPSVDAPASDIATAATTNQPTTTKKNFAPEEKEEGHRTSCSDWGISTSQGRGREKNKKKCGGKERNIFCSVPTKRQRSEGGNIQTNLGDPVR